MSNVPPSSEGPVIEVDTEASAIYIRFSNEEVAETLPLSTDDSIVMADLDSSERVVGVEMVGTIK